MAHVASETAVAQERRFRMTYEEFLASELSESHAEWVDGEVIVFMPPSERHHDIAGFLYTLLTLLLRRTGQGKVIHAPFEMRFSSKSSREPDLLFVSNEHRDRLDGQRLHGPADLAVELISPDSVARDRADKFYEYQQASVSEYLVIDPRRTKERLDLHRLGADGKYQAMLPDADGRYHFVSLPGLWLEEAWLWHEPLPDPLDILLQIAPERFRGLALSQE